MWEVALSLFAIGAESAKCQCCSEGPQGRMEAVMIMQQGVRIRESSLRETAQKKWKQPKGEDRSEMKTRGKTVEVHLD